jgi:hypothetical protein
MSRAIYDPIPAGTRPGSPLHARPAVSDRHGRAPVNPALPRQATDTRPGFGPPKEDAFPHWAACRGED